ncbi:MAG TPA: xanthine dehydrogenase family protein molybdopterin-binding subunit [Candidatus Tectomicrobia bacterium]|nr:xanthine dehydrogenase family protein molybdopterin-binding subunit [Candidatus Tectomicrobia bacterium]
MAYNAVGKPLGRVEGPLKVTGQATYSADVLLPGMIWGRVLRSPLPHARIVRIDTHAAERVPGVLSVLTAKDLPDLLIGRRVYDMPVLARDCVRFIGEKVAVVAAEDPNVAEEALAQIEVEYEELPAVFDAQEAMTPEAPLLHPHYRSYPHAPAKYFSDIPNVHSHVTWALGDVAQGFASAARVFEHTFTTHYVHQGYIEPHASVVAIEPDGRAHVWLSNKMPFRTKELLADAVQIPQEQIVVHLTPIGGDFGGKGSLMDLPLCYHLARRTGRPVKMVMSYAEELMAGNPRHPTTVVLRSGVTGEGKIIAREAKVIFNSGAYAAFKPTAVVNITGASQAAGAYGIPNVRIDAYSVYTNCVPAGHMRAPGDPQVSFAVESSMDMMAEALGLDPLEFRRRNLLRDGDRLPSGHPVEHVKIRETIEAAVHGSRWGQAKPRPHVGRGLAVAHRHIGIGDANAQLTVDQDGTVALVTAVPDTGTGAHTVLRQIVAETLSLPVEQVRVEVATTDVFEADSGAGGSRVTHVAGQAAYQAAGELKGLIHAVAARLLGCEPDRVTLAGGRCAVADGVASGVSLAEVAEAALALERPLRVQKTYRVADYPHVTAFTAQAVELEVDPETGQMTLLDVVTAHDVGTVINPLGHQGQIEGGLIQGIGFGMIEEMRSDEGRISTLSLGDYKLPNIKDIPPLRTVLVQEQLGPAPFQGKSIGENSVTPITAAIANALYDAVGVRICDLPITAEKVYHALQARKDVKENTPARDGRRS